MILKIIPIIKRKCIKKIKECILNTLLNKPDNIDSNSQYEEVISYLDDYTDDFWAHILLKAMVKSNDNNELASLLKDFSFCLDAAYELAYTLSLSKALDTPNIALKN